jgi:hypothetical protein
MIGSLLDDLEIRAASATSAQSGSIPSSSSAAFWTSVLAESSPSDRMRM